MHRRLTGISTPRAEFSPVNIGGTTIEGGYFPIVADQDNSAATSVTGKIQNTADYLKGGTMVDARRISMGSLDLAEGKSSNFGANAMTSHGRMKERVKNSEIRVSLRFDSLGSHVEETIHDLAFREALINVNSFVTHRDVADKITQKLGPEMYGQLKPWLQSIATNRTGTYVNALDAIFSVSRAGGNRKDPRNEGLDGHYSDS